MRVQQGFEFVDLALVDGAFRQHYVIDAADLVNGCEEHPIHKVKVELFCRRELEQAERLPGKPVHRALEWTEVGLSHPQRPRQQ